MAVKPVNPVAEKQAKLLALDNRKAEPDVTRVFWFPDDQEVRLVELTEVVPINPDDDLHPFYFRPSPRDDMPLPTALAMIRPDEFGKLKPPSEWGNWSDAVEL
ncbi:MAG: hypothetical protein ACE15C_02360 [Phycisphaerae bacterium]